jgi:4-amino-4-deoxy-L-arabinose transferase-like glycosyltransferase
MMALQRQGTGRGWLRGDWIAAAVLLLLVLVTRVIWFGDPVPEFDEQLYSLIGWRMTQGDLPYVDVWDRKPLGLFAIFALSHWLLGAGPAAYQIVASAWAFAGALLVYTLARGLVDRISATVAGALYLIFLALYGSYSGQSEVFHTPLMLAMLLLVRDWRRPDAVRRALAAMLVGGLALQVKYTVLPQCVFCGAYALYGQWRAGARMAHLTGLAALFASLGILPTALVALLYLLWGHFDAFWFANFTSFFERLPGPSGRLRPDLLPAIAPIIAVLVLGLFAAVRLNPPRDWRIYGLYCGWAVSVVATVLLPATVYLYYYAALAPAAALVALPLIDRTAPAKFIPALLLLAGGAYLLDFPRDFARAKHERRTEARLAGTIAPYVGAHRDCLYVFDGPAALYRSTKSCLPTRFIYPDHLNNALETPALGVDQAGEIARILASRPGVIVTAKPAVTVQRPLNLALIRNATAAHYEKLMTVRLGGRAVTAWVRRDLAHE